jgi:hypothetical protein
MDSAASNYNADATTDNGSCVYATTFNVDMSCATNVGAMLNGSTGFSEVFVTGPIFGWSANDGYNQLTDADGDGIYSVTLDFPAGDVEYKYAIDGFADQEQLIDDMQNGADCAPITDFAGYANRLVVAGSATNDTYGSCSSCADQVDPVNVTFQVDMSQYAEPYAFGGVFVNGSFNGWCGVCNPLTDTGGGLWSVTLPLNPGTIEYKFTLDGWNYQEEFAGGESCTSTIDGYTNRSLTFDADVTLAAVCWESCDVCPDTSDVLGCMDSSANNYNAEATVEPENSCLYDVTLSVDASQTSFTSMTLAGTFNGWNNLSNPMDDSDGDGVYFVTVSMTAGNQEYKFLGNGDWGVAEVFDGSESCTTPPAEFVNRVILVEGPTVADTVCYNTCEACVDGAVLGCTDESANNYNAGADTDDGSCLYNTTFNVDMSCAGVDFTEVFVTGPLWGWPANSGFNAMTDADGDGIYSVTIETPAGNIEYKYAINGFADQENLIDDMQNGASCAPVTDYNGYANRLAASGSTTNDTYGSCEACPQGVEGCIDETACNYNPEANTDDGSCEFAPDYYECDGETCINDTDGDGVCDELEVEGCVVPTACNYVASGVTQLVPCVYPDPGYNCDGTCISDTDGDGTCDANEIVGCQDSAACNYDASATDEGTCDYDSCLGCTDEAACNYDDSATQDDGTCDFCSCANEASGGVNGFNLSVETHAEDGIPGLTTYRVYVTTPNATDFVSAIAGDSEVASYLRTSTSFYQNPLGGLTAGAINPLFFGSFPDIQYDSWLTIGIDQAPVPGDGTADVTIAQAAGDTWPQDFEAGGNLEMDSFFGGSWFTTNLTSNGVAGDDLKVLVAQLTTDGSLTGQLFVQVFPLGVGADAEYLTLSFGNSTCGCTDASACNYSEGAIYDDGSCFFVGIYDCDASCVNDADQDGVCDELEIVGCSDSEACNYNPDATDEGACEYVEPTLLPSEGGCGLFFSGYAEGSGNHKFMEIYNPTDADIDLSGYAFPNVSNAPDNGAGNYDFWNAFPEGAMIAAGDVYVIAHGSADASILAEADMTFNFLSNGDDGFMLVQGDEANYIMIDAIGDFNGDPGSGWDVAGVTNGTQNHSLIRKSNITSGNGGDWIGSAGTDAENSEWIVLDQDDWTGVGSHEFTGDCAAGNYAVIYDCDGVCLNDSDQDGVCDEIEIDGCTDSGACNYDLLATDEDGSCEYLTCAGCTDPVGCNYDSSATIEDGSCTYPEAFYDCDGNCVNDLNINGICDELEVLGCTYSAACNYDMDANVDDGQCDFSCLLTGCTDTAADNYDAAATVDDGNCFYVGCLDSNALNYDSGANFPGNCEYCEGDFNYDGEVDVNDLLDFFQLWGNTCD